MSAGVQAWVRAREPKRGNSSFHVNRTKVPVTDSPSDQIAFLQRTVGNREVERLLKSGGIQGKLKIGQSDDAYEQEANRVSEQVMRMPETQASPARTWNREPAKFPAGQLGSEQESLPTAQVQGSDGKQIAAPGVDEVLRTPGQPLDPATRFFMERRFGHDFSPIRIHTDKPAAEASAALGAEAFTVGHHIAFAQAHFLPGTADGKRLVAHELAHTIQQSGATSPHIALKPNKEPVAPAPGSLKFAGVLLGINRSKKEVRVKREVGGTQGYDDRLQAIAVARLANAEPSVVVLGTDKKWHALETTAEFQVGRVSANDPKAAETALGGNVPFVEVHGLPSLAGISPSRQKVDELKKKLSNLDDLEKQWKTDPEFRKAVRGANPPFLKALEDERTQVTQNLSKTNQTHAALILGVPETEIQFNVHSSGRTAGKINITGQPGMGSAGGLHGPRHGEFKPGVASSFEIDLRSSTIPPERSLRCSMRSRTSKTTSSPKRG